MLARHALYSPIQEVIGIGQVWQNVCLDPLAWKGSFEGVVACLLKYLH